MARFALSIILATALCYTLQAEGATLGDLFAAISSAGREVRELSIKRVMTETGLDGVVLPPAQEACVRSAVFAGLKEYQTVIGQEQNRLRARAAVDWAGRIAELTADQVREEVSQELWNVVNPVLDKVVADIKACQ